MQTELASKLRATWPYLACGQFGEVLASPCGEWVVKSACNDGTRTYLEWCLHKQAKGQGMRGMPEIDFLVQHRCGHYLVTLRRYTPLCSMGDDSLLPESGLPMWSGCITDLRCCPDYVKALVEAFISECREPRRYIDLHRLNIMWDDRTNTLIVTDPSMGDYRPMPVERFELYETAPEVTNEVTNEVELVRMPLPRDPIMTSCDFWQVWMNEAALQKPIGRPNRIHPANRHMHPRDLAQARFKLVDLKTARWC